MTTKVDAAERVAEEVELADRLVFLDAANDSIASMCTASRPRRVCPSESNAPALISDSMVFLLQTTASTLLRKS